MSLRAFHFVMAMVLAPVPLVAQVMHDTVVLRPVVVTATRVPVSTELVSAAIRVLLGADLRERGLRTVADALRAVEGAAVFETGSYGGQTSLFLRGGESDYVKVLMDGVPLNQPGGAFDFADLTLDNVERIEIVRGPASVLYGSDAVTGVIQIFSRRGSGPAQVEIEGRAGAHRTIDISMRGQAGSPRAGVTFAASRFGSDGIFALNNEYRNATVSARARFRPDDVTEASLSYRYGDKTYHFPTDGAGRPVDSNQLSSERGPVASLAVRRTVGELELHATATFREARLVYSDEPDSPGQFGFASRDLVRRASGGVQLDWRRGDGSVLSAGLEYEDARQRGRNTFESPAPVARWNRAAYAQALFGAERSLSANAGFRLEDNSQFGSHPTYRGGVAYRLSTDTRLRAMVGTGFKEPTFFENFASGFVTGNPALEPEQSTSWEVGVEQRFGSSALVVTYFDQRFRDLIEYSPTPVSPNFVNYFNVAGAVVRGVEAVLDGPLGGGGMSARIAYTFLHTRVAAGGPGADPDGAFLAGEALLRRPAHTLTAQLRIAFLERGTITLDGRWVGRRDDLDFSRPNDDQRVSLPPYARIDANAEFDVIRGPRVVSLSARLENVFDSRAEEIANFPSRGRGLFLGARMRIGS